LLACRRHRHGATEALGARDGARRIARSRRATDAHLRATRREEGEEKEGEDGDRQPRERARRATATRDGAETRARTLDRSIDSIARVADAPVDAVDGRRARGGVAAPARAAARRRAVGALMGRRAPSEERQHRDEDSGTRARCVEV